MTWADFKTLVKNILSDVYRNDTTYVMAASDFVKARFAREVDRDIERFDSYNKSYLQQRAKLLGYAYSGTASYATGILGFIGQPSNGQTVTIGTKVYTAQTVLTNVDGHFLIGATADDTANNFIAAVNLGVGAGTTYAAATTLNTNVTAVVGAKISATATLNMTGPVFTADGATIGGKFYLFETPLTNTNGHVFVAVDTQQQLKNFADAINLGPGSGVEYAAATTLHPTVSATFALNPNVPFQSMNLTAKTAGANGNTIVLSGSFLNGNFDGNMHGGITNIAFTSKLAGSSGNSIVTTTTMTQASWGGATLSNARDSTLLSDVKKLLTVDAARQGTSDYLQAVVNQAQQDIEGLGGTIDNLIRQGCIDLQKDIELFRVGHETTFLNTDFSLNGMSSVGVMPTEAEIRDAYFISKSSGVSGVDILTEGTNYTNATATFSGDGTGATGTPVIVNGKIVGVNMTSFGLNYTNCTVVFAGDGSGATGIVAISSARVPLRPFDWSNRATLIAGKAIVNSSTFYLSIDPYGQTFYVYPVVDDAHKVVMTWDGLKLDFQDGDTVPFSEMFAGACAEYVNGMFARDVEHDYAVYGACMKERTGTYVVKRKRLLLDAQERTRMKNA